MRTPHATVGRDDPIAPSQTTADGEGEDSQSHLARGRGAKVVLKARNPEVEDIVLENEAEYSTRYRAIAEFKGVVR